MYNIITHSNIKILNECRTVGKFSSQKRVYVDTSFFSFLSQKTVVVGPVCMRIESEVPTIIKITTWWQD